MKRLAIAVVALATLAGPMAAPVLAQTKMDSDDTVAALDCGGLYKDFWRKLDRDKYAKISAEQRAAWHYAPTMHAKPAMSRTPTRFSVVCGGCGSRLARWRMGVVAARTLGRLWS